MNFSIDFYSRFDRYFYASEPQFMWTLVKYKEQTGVYFLIKGSSLMLKQLV